MAKRSVPLLGNLLGDRLAGPRPRPTGSHRSVLGRRLGDFSLLDQRLDYRGGFQSDDLCHRDSSLGDHKLFTVSRLIQPVPQMGSKIGDRYIHKGKCTTIEQRFVRYFRCRRGAPINDFNRFHRTAKRLHNPFADAAEAAIEACRRGWRDHGRTEAIWRSSLERFVYPSIGSMPVDQITPADLSRVLLPTCLWTLGVWRCSIAAWQAALPTMLSRRRVARCT